jgi:hypothetical protein
MPANQNYDQRDSFVVLISLALQKQKFDSDVSDYWLTKYCTNELNQNDTKQFELALASSNELFSKWLEVKNDIDTHMLSMPQAIQLPQKRQVKKQSWLAAFSAWKIWSGLSLAGVFALAVLLIQPWNKSTLAQIQPGHFIAQSSQMKSLNIPTNAVLKSSSFLAGVNYTITKFVLNTEDWPRFVIMDIHKCESVPCSKKDNMKFQLAIKLVESHLYCLSEDVKVPKAYMQKLVEQQKQVDAYMPKTQGKFERFEQDNFCEAVGQRVQALINLKNNTASS